MFDRIKRSSLRIRRAKSYFGGWDCTKGCFDIPKPYQQFLTFHTSSKDIQQQMYTSSDPRIQHIYTRFTQREGYRQAWKHLQPHEILVAQDFGTLTCPPNATEKDHYVTDFCVLLRWKDESNETENRLYIDLLCDDKTRKNDFYYLRYAWRYLLFNTSHFQHFSHIIIFSDGAAKHFKQRFTMKFFADVSIESGRTIAYNFFASYHGYGMLISLKIMQLFVTFSFIMKD